MKYETKEKIDDIALVVAKTGLGIVAVSLLMAAGAVIYKTWAGSIPTPLLKIIVTSFISGVILAVVAYMTHAIVDD